MSTTVKVQIQQRIDTASAWTTANPTLLAGEVGWESDTKKYKIGDGSTAWASLTYAPGSGGYTAGTGVSISASNVITASAVALTTVQTAANQTAHLALTTQEGDVVVRSDENKSYVRNSGTAGSMADFTLLATPTDAVLSVNGNTGAITADQLAAAIEAASDSNTFTDADHTKLNSALTTSDLLDEDNFATNSATKAASQQSVKAYVDTADALKANLSGATFTGTVVFTGDAANVTWDKSTDDLIFNDNAKAIFGTSSDGVSIYHDGSNSYILNSTGELQLRDQSRIKLRTDQFVINNFANDENIIYAAANGSVELYEDGVKKAETTSDGFNVEGTLYANGIDMDDNHIIKLGLGDDLQIYHDGNHSYLVNTTGNIYITDDSYIELSSANGGEKYATFTKDGAAELYYDGTKKLETDPSGVKFNDATYVLDTKRSYWGTGNDLRIFHDGSNSYIDQNGTGNLLIRQITSGHIEIRGDYSELMGKFSRNLGVELYYDNVKRLDTRSWGVKGYGYFAVDGSSGYSYTAPDNSAISLGSHNDLRLWHDGTNNHILADNGELINRAATWKVTNEANTENIILAGQNGAVSLYYDHSKKFETTSGGVNVTGAITVNGSPLAGGNTVSLVADGAIAAGKPCIIKSNGKAEQVKTTASRGTPSAMSGAHIIGGSATNWGVVRADPATGHGVLIYLDANSGDYVRAQGFKTNPSDGSLALSGSALDLQNDGTGGSANSLTHLTGNKFLAVYRRGSNSDLAYKVITYNSSHGTVTAGSQTTASQNGMLYTQQQICAVSGSKAVVVYRDQGDSNKGKACVISISGTSVSVGSPVTFWSSATNYHSVCYDSNADRIVVQWNAGSSNIAIVGTVSGTSITFGSAVTVGTASAHTSMCFESTNNKMILAWNEGSTAMKLRVATVATSGNSLTFDAAAETWYGAQPGKIELAFVPHVGSICILFSQSGNSNRLVLYTGYLNTSTGKAQYEYQLVAQSSVNGYAALTQTTSGYLVVSSQQNTGNYNTRIRTIKAFVDATNATSKNVIGFAPLAISDGNTGTINCDGNTVDNQSSLTAGTSYWVQNDGTLGTSVASTLAGGIALSSTKLLIKQYAVA